MNMPYNSSDATEDNLDRDIDLDLGSFERWAELDRDLITLDDDAQNKILSSLSLAAACSNYF